MRLNCIDKDPVGELVLGHSMTKSYLNIMRLFFNYYV